MKFYIASKFENADMVRIVAAVLRAAGHKHTYDWTEHGSVKGQGRNRLRQVAITEVQGVLDADIVIVILPGGRGTHAELGIALAGGKRIIICSETQGPFDDSDSTCAFYWNPEVVVRCVGSVDRWLCEIFLQIAKEDR